MITNFTFEKKGDFTISGTIDQRDIDFENKELLKSDYYSNIILKLLSIKKTISKSLSDDNKITGSERIDVIKSIDTFLITLFSLGFIHTKNSEVFCCSKGELFNINLQINKTGLLKGNGLITNVSSQDISDYHNWFDKNIIENFKHLITLLKDSSNKEPIIKILSEIIYYTIVFRFKVEYI